MNEYLDSGRKEINLMNLMHYCLEKWRWIVASMLFMAVLLGGFKYQATVKDNMASRSEENVMEDMEENVNSSSVGFYNSAIEEAERDLNMQEDYLKHSTVMQMDPYHILTGTLSYYVEGGEHIGSVIAAYSTFISSGRMAEELYGVDENIPVEDLRYLISFANNTNEVYKTDSNQVITIMDKAGNSQGIRVLGTGGTVFQVQIRMPDSSSGEDYMKRVEEIMEGFMSKLQAEVEGHTLRLLSSVQSEMTDLEIQEYQSTMRSSYTASVKNLQALKTEFKTIQDAQDTTGGEIISVVSKNPVSSAVKYAILGLVLGGFLSCFILLVYYLLGGRLQDTEYFNEEFGMPLLGIVRASEKKKKLFGFVDTWLFRLGGDSYAKINFEEQAKIAASNVQTEALKNSFGQETSKIMLSGTIAEKEVAALCMQLESEIHNIVFSPYMQIAFQSAALRELENYDGVLFLEKKGSSYSNLIMQEKKLALDRGVKILGTIVVC